MSSIEERCGAMIRQGATIEEVLAQMRREGFSRTNAIAVLGAVNGIPLNEAKLLVHNSSVWADLRQQADDLHKDVESSVNELSRDPPAELIFR